MNFFTKAPNIPDQSIVSAVAELNIASQNALPSLQTASKKRKQPASAVEYDATTGKLTASAYIRTNWFANPWLFAQIHECVVRCGFSFREAAKNFNKQFYPAVIPKEIAASTLQNWYVRANNGISWQLDAKFLPLLTPGAHISRGGGPLIFKDYPGVQADICSMIQKQRKAGIPINSNIARELIYAYLIHIKFPSLDYNGGAFKCSHSWVRKFLQRVCLCSYRKSTKAAQSTPVNAEEQCNLMVERMALLVAKYKIRKEFIVNCDQTGVNLVPVSAYSYEVTGSVDCSILGKSQKKQITAVAAVSASNVLLPFQLIYAGKAGSVKALPTMPTQLPLLRNGFHFTQTPSHWSNALTSIEYIQRIIVPYYQKQAEDKKIDYGEQHAILLLDVWHRDKTFLDFMAQKFPRIHLVFVPGGCTGLIQPCDVFIQRPFKHALLQQFSKWAAQEVLNELSKGKTAEDIRLDLSITRVREVSCSWILFAWTKVMQMTEMMETGWSRRCGITDRIFRREFQLETELKWLKRGWNPDRVFVPIGKIRDPGARVQRRVDTSGSESDSAGDTTETDISEEEQHESAYDSYGEDEGATTEAVAEECLNDQLIAEALQAEEDDDF